MILDNVLLVIGIVLLIYGVRVKTKFFTIAGVVLIAFALISGGIDYKMGNADSPGIPSYRLPFVIDKMMR